MAQLIGILAIEAHAPAVNQLTEIIDLGEGALADIEMGRLGHHLPERLAFLRSRIHNPGKRGVANTARGIVDDTLQGLLIIGIDHHTEIGNHVLDLLALVEAQAAIDAIRDTVLAHLFLEGTALGIGAVEDGKIAVFASLLTTDTTDILAHDDGLFLVAIGRFKLELLALVVPTENVLGNLSFVLANQTVGSPYDELRRTVVLLQFEETGIIV